MSINPINGPYDARDRAHGSPLKTQVIFSAPAKEVGAAQLLVALAENSNILTGSQTSGWIAVEVSFLGFVGGFGYLLKRQQIRQMTGPAIYNVPDDLPFEQIVVQTRNVTGGVIDWGVPAGVTMKTQVYVQAGKR